jgi:hypothetical protein
VPYTSISLAIFNLLGAAATRWLAVVLWLLARSGATFGPGRKEVERVHRAASQKTGTNPSEPQHVLTEPWIGYRFDPDGGASHDTAYQRASEWRG